MSQQIGQQPAPIMLPVEQRLLVATMHWHSTDSLPVDTQVIAYNAKNEPIDGMHLHWSCKTTKDNSLTLNPVQRMAIINLDGLERLSESDVHVARVGFELAIFAGSLRNQTLSGLTRAMLEIGNRYDPSQILARRFHTGPHNNHRLSLGDLVNTGAGWAFMAPPN